MTTEFIDSPGKVNQHDALPLRGEGAARAQRHGPVRQGARIAVLGVSYKPGVAMCASRRR